MTHGTFTARDSVRLRRPQRDSNPRTRDENHEFCCLQCAPKPVKQGRWWSLATVCHCTQFAVVSNDDTTVTAQKLTVVFGHLESLLFSHTCESKAALSLGEITKFAEYVNRTHVVGGIL